MGKNLNKPNDTDIILPKFQYIEIWYDSLIENLINILVKFNGWSIKCNFSKTYKMFKPLLTYDSCQRDPNTHVNWRAKLLEKEDVQLFWEFDGNPSRPFWLTLVERMWCTPFKKSFSFPLCFFILDSLLLTSETTTSFSRIFDWIILFRKAQFRNNLTQNPFTNLTLIHVSKNQTFETWF